MERENSRGFTSQIKWGNQLENLAIIILAFYPLRHIRWGLDLWDTGYNYANFQYIGTEHMDSMWLFSTYLANVAGHLLTGLPKADTLVGMNLYTGLFASLLALTGYFFCTRKLQMPKAIAFLGEMTALSLCWCPTAVLYNYLTYVLFLFSMIFLYLGLTKEKKGYLVGAGALLGANVLVRFSNLPEAAMIVAVWVYDIILWLEGRDMPWQRTAEHGKGDPKSKGGERVETVSGQTKDAGHEGSRPESGQKGCATAEGFWRRTIRHTLWCLQGYAAALGVLFLFIHIRYGIREYTEGILRLFAMTENAADYKPAAMITGILHEYVVNLYWGVRFGVIVVGGMVLFAVATWIEEWIAGRFGASAGVGKLSGLPILIARAIHFGIRIAWAAGCMVMIGWLYRGNFFSLLYYSYDSIWHPGPLFLMLTMLIAVIRIFHQGSPREEKLISCMLILIIMLTPIGSNNGILPSLNNLFLAAPYVLWESWRFLRFVKDKRIGKRWVLSSFPAKGVLTALMALCLFQFGAFGIKFAFAEATGIQDTSAVVENNPILRNVGMSPEKAQWMTELSAYVEENGLQGKEVILYGRIPSLSYYLQMPSAFNPWSDLDSYGLAAMEKDMALLEERIRNGEKEKPVIILENVYALYEEAGAEIAKDAGEKISGENGKKLDADSKWTLLLEFMDDFEYEQSFRNGKFAVYR